MISLKHNFITHVWIVRLILIILALSGSINDLFAQSNTRVDAIDVPFDLSRLYGVDLIMKATNTRRDAFEFYAVRTDGAFSYQLYDREVFDRTPNTTGSETWENTPVQFLVFDGQSTLLASYPPDPLSVVDTIHLDRPLPVGESVHLKACPWPILPVLADGAVWTKSDDGNYTLHPDELPITILFSAHGRLLRIEKHVINSSGSTLDGIWRFAGFKDTPGSIIPTSLTRSLRVLRKDGSTEVEQTDEFSLEFNPPRQKFAQMIEIRCLINEMYARNPKTGDVTLPNGDFLYNESDELNKYYKAVGLKNPGRTRHALFTIITVLGLVSVIVIWKKKLA